MIKLSKQELKIVEKHIKIISTIITNHSCSFITPEFRADIKTVAESHKLPYCDNCNSGLFNLCAQLYAAYNQSVNKNKDK